MAKPYFKLQKITDVKNLGPEDIIPESDFSLFTSDDKFVQFEFVEGEEDTSIQQYTVKSGIYSISMLGNKLVLKDAMFSNDSLLEEYIVTKDISDKINTFFNRISIYTQYGIFPKRGMLLYGSPGAGKSVAISKVCNEYKEKADTVTVIWPSDKFEARHVKDFIKAFDYETHSIKKLILVIEDLGGTEHTDRGQSPSQASLLSLLDNVDGTFRIPTMIVATTNYPENFLENLTNRPQRFDDVMEVKRPSGEFRAKFLDFFSQQAASEADRKMIENAKYDTFSVAHVKEIVIRAALYNIPFAESIEQVAAQSQRSKKGFSNQKAMGFGS